MRVVLCGASGEYFNLSDKQKKKLKNNIIKYLLSCELNNSESRIDIKVDDGFGLIATESCLEYTKLKSDTNFIIDFFCVYREEFTDLPDELKQYYIDIMELSKEQYRNVRFVDYTCNCGSRDANITDYKTSFTNCFCKHIAQREGLITYLDKKSSRDKLLYRILDRYDVTGTKKGIVDLYAASNNLYDNADYTGIRKQKNTSKYYYRINIKLPDGTPVNVEKGSFYTVEEANKARREHLVSLTTQDCENVDKTVDEVFKEFISITCKDKASLEKKYLSYYNSRIKDTMGNIKIGETQAELSSLYNLLTNYQVKDNRSRDSKVILTKGYVSGLRAMLCNLFDYAYNMKYISSHPMYTLPSKWGHKEPKEYKLTKKSYNYIEPLFAYLGNKHKLLPELIKLFPKDIEELSFIDLFGGSGVVTVNLAPKESVLNEKDRFLYGIYKGLQDNKPEDAWKLIESIVEKYNLNKENEDGYYRCRDDYNRIDYEDRCINYWYWGLSLVYCSFNRSTVQFNLQNEYNAPFGYNKVNFDLAKRKFFAFAKKIYDSRIVLKCEDYKSVIIPKDAFVYLDPPYLITTATYNKGWSEEDEKGLYEYLEMLNANGIKWALSNVIENNGVVNYTLKEWIMGIQAKQKNTFFIHYLDAEYLHANFRRKNKGKTVEILLTNYRN